MEGAQREEESGKGQGLLEHPACHEIPEGRPALTTYFVSRHPGALAWAARQGLHIDLQLNHLNPDTVQPGDIVIGTLPIHLAARLCALGARYLHLSLDLPAEARGQELSAIEMESCKARIEEYCVTEPASLPPHHPM